jgi:cobalt-zinc-cadmium efflux system outer membrane protein
MRISAFCFLPSAFSLSAFCFLLSAFSFPAQAIDWNDPHSVVEAAIAASPSLRELDANLAAARARQLAAGATPNPMLMAGVQNQQIDLSRDPMMTMYTVGASQTFVRGERRDVLQRAARLDVERLEHEAESRRAEITRDVLVAYDEAAAASNQIAANEEIAKLASMMGDAVRARYEVGAAAQIDIIRAKIEASNVWHQILMQQGVRNTALARIRALLNLAPNETVPSFALAHAMEHHAHADDVSLDASTPAISALESEVERAEQDIRLAKLATKPDFNIEASYGMRPLQKDMFSVVGRIELPIRRKTTIEPRIAEAMARRDAARAQIDVLRQQLAAGFGEAVASRNEAIEQINLHVEELVPEAKLGFESALASYQAGKTTFDAVLGALQTYRSLNVDYYEFLRQLLIAEAEIDALERGATGRSGTAMGGAR